MRLSKRIERIQPSPTLAVTAQAKALIRQGVDVCSFAAGEPDFATPSHICEAAIDAINAGHTRYTAAPGMPAVREALSRFLSERFGLDYGADEVILTVGGKHALYNIFQCLLDDGDEVIIPAPFWVSYPAQVELAGGTPVLVSATSEAGYKVTPESIEAAVTPRTRAIVLNSPCNPTGAAYTKEELTALAQVAVKHDFIIISDEIYGELTYDGFEFHSIPALGVEFRERTIIASGWSKTYSMTGWRLGWAAAPRSFMSAMGKLQSQSTSNVPGMTQMAAMAALEGSHDFLPEWIQAFDRRRRTMVSGLNGMEGVRCPSPQGAFYVFPDFSGVLGRQWKGSPIGTSLRLAEFLLEEARVAVVPGEAFGAPGCARLSYATSDEVIKKGLSRIQSALSSLDG